MAIGFIAGIGKLLTDLRPFLRLISVFSLIGVVLLGLNSCELSRQLTEAQEQNERQLEEINGLRGVLIDQNASIDRLHQLTEQANIKMEAAMKVAQTNNRQLAKAASDIKSMRARTCEDTQPMVQRAIKALREGL